MARKSDKYSIAAGALENTMIPTSTEDLLPGDLYFRSYNLATISVRSPLIVLDAYENSRNTKIITRLRSNDVDCHEYNNDVCWSVAYRELKFIVVV